MNDLKTTPAQAVANSKVVIFDLFHTLLSFKSDGTPGRNTSEALGIPENLWNKLLWESSERRLRNNHDDDAAIIRELARLHDPAMPEEKILLAADERAVRFRHCLMHPPEQRVRILRSLHERGHKLVLLSNADAMEKRGWSESPFAPLFTAALFSCDTGHVKPEPAAYAKALEVCGAHPGEAVFVGDGGSNELKGAKACGITTILTTEIIAQIWPESIPRLKADADYCIENLAELL